MKFRVQAAFSSPGMAGKGPFFEQERCRPVSFEVRGVDYQTSGTTSLLRQGDEDSVKNTKSAPSDEAIMVLRGPWAFGASFH
ncbi:hypothetical protein HK28_04030 [Acetobacter sp. DsW_063]|nr:hypothetical protein HK28_04030 [Acetobacter sp. DsW_063]